MGFIQIKKWKRERRATNNERQKMHFTKFLHHQSSLIVCSLKTRRRWVLYRNKKISANVERRATNVDRWIWIFLLLLLFFFFSSFVVCRSSFAHHENDLLNQSSRITWKGDSTKRRRRSVLEAKSSSANVERRTTNVEKWISFVHSPRKNSEQKQRTKTDYENDKLARTTNNERRASKGKEKGWWN